MNAEQIEAEIQSKGLTAPRITQADIEAVIASEHYFTAADGVGGAALNNGVVDVIDGKLAVSMPKEMMTITVCVLILKNRHKIVGINEGPVSPENFDAELARKLARKHATSQMWPLLGFALKERLFSEKAAAIEATPDTPSTTFMSFRDFVQYGRDNGGNIVNGMPWSFSFKGYAVTHENDKCYLLMRGAESLRLTDDDDLVIHGDGSLGVTACIPF
jgi:hypothetical protein